MEEARALIIQWILHLSVDTDVVAGEMLADVAPEHRDLIMAELCAMSEPPNQRRLDYAWDALAG